jgi:hypothetical protein
LSERIFMNSFSLWSGCWWLKLKKKNPSIINSLFDNMFLKMFSEAFVW